eukprot:CAMPEP_0179853846 /NCGR_PEP_ID=MMETSP0982-20121206/9583_1 /TAXON_ID=483367 /ORGANISM="non described non described, Strain CCMP 2436" /LENGTH=82 /DNA_ID=CAMNT_0021739623 /DNA_START=254 /DNA_END=499 /DNA_ORIENTATION=+
MPCIVSVRRSPALASALYDCGSDAGKSGGAGEHQRRIRPWSLHELPPRERLRDCRLGKAQTDDGSRQPECTPVPAQAAADRL